MTWPDQTDESWRIAIARTEMKVDLDELRQKIDYELKMIVEREADLQKQLEHLTVVQNLAVAAPPEGTSNEGLDISDFREALLGSESG